MPRGLRERIAALTGERRTTAAEVLREFLDADDRRRRFEAVRAAYATEDPDHVAETEVGTASTVACRRDATD